MIETIREILKHNNFADLITFDGNNHTLIPVIYMFDMGKLLITLSIMNSQPLIDIKSNNTAKLVVEADKGMLIVTATAQIKEDWKQIEDEWLSADIFASELKNSNQFIPQFWKRNLLVLTPIRVELGSKESYDLEVIS